MPDLHTIRAEMATVGHDGVIKAGKTSNFPALGTGFTLVQIAQWKSAIGRFLKNLSNEGHREGMKGFLTDGDPLNKRKATEWNTASKVLAKSKAKADRDKKAATDAGQDAADIAAIVPEITDRREAADEADRMNLAGQAIVGIKEGLVSGIVEVAGNGPTDAVVKDAGGQEDKHIDDISIPALFKALEANAVRATAIDLLDQTHKAIFSGWDFTQPCAVNIENDNKAIGLLKERGIIIGPSVQAITTIANIEEAVKHAWGAEFVHSLRNIRKAHGASKEHDATSLAAIATELAEADAVRNLGEAGTIELTSGTAQSVQAQFSHLNDLIHQAAYERSEQSLYDGTASAVDSEDEESDDESAAERAAAVKKAAKKAAKKEKEKRGRSKSRDHGSNEAEEWESNPCTHCRHYCRNKQHPNVDPKDCFWNKQYKGHRQAWVCREMDIEYVPEHVFKKKAAAKRKQKKKGGAADDEE